MCCELLAENTARKKLPKSRHLSTIPQLCRTISSQLRQVSTIGKKIVKNQYLPHMSPQYGELGPLAADIDPVVWGTTANFNGFRVLAALLHGTRVLRVSHTLRHWTEAPPIFDRAAITLGIGPHSSSLWFLSFFFSFLAYSQRSHTWCLPYFHTWCGPQFSQLGQLSNSS